jgi:hypothetical protein
MKKENEFTLTKSTVECYKIRHSTGMYWADITIDASERAGRIQIASDFGDYQNYWGACGSSFKDFLCQIDIDYAANKFGANKWFDHEKTIGAMKETVLQYRRNCHIESDRARVLYDEIQSLDCCYDVNEFKSELMATDELMPFYDHCPDLVYDVSPQFKKFWNTVWPIFLNELKNEKVETC